ncbi:MAG: helix-turn-helix transcriptional regulator [bacterium]|nr:helix-turn-helix transcriptional regulator [bacterium]
MEEKELNRIIGKNIKKYRQKCIYNGKKLSQEKLAEIINVSVSLISNVESNKSDKGISLTNLYKISIVLDIPISKFFEVNNDSEIH